MSFLDDAACVLWSSNPLYWQGVAALHAAKKAGIIKNRSECEAAAKQGSDIASTIGIPTALSGTFGKCACRRVFKKHEQVNPGQQPDRDPAEGIRYHAVFVKASEGRPWVHGWEHEDFAAVSEEMRGQGYQITDLNAFVLPGADGVRYNGVWTKSTADRQAVFGWAPEHFDAKDSEMRSQGYNLVVLNAFVIPDGVRYNGIWAKTGGDRTWVHGWAPEHFDAKATELQGQGYDLVDLNAFVLPGNAIRYNGIFAKQNGERPWVHGWLPEHFDAKDAEMRGQGYQLVNLNGFILKGDGIRYNGIWAKTGGDRTWVHGWTRDDFDKKAAELQGQGYSPVTLHGFVVEL